jgi:hypothetical protein
MTQSTDLSGEEMAALEQLVARLHTPAAATMQALASGGLVWRTGAGWTVSQAGWRSIRGRRPQPPLQTGLDVTAPRRF